MTPSCVAFLCCVFLGNGMRSLCTRCPSCPGRLHVVWGAEQLVLSSKPGLGEKGTWTGPPHNTDFLFFPSSLPSICALLCLAFLCVLSPSSFLPLTFMTQLPSPEAELPASTSSRYGGGGHLVGGNSEPRLCVYLECDGGGGRQEAQEPREGRRTHGEG